MKKIASLITSTQTAEGSLWVDSANKKLKIFLNSKWNTVSIEAQ